jgi:hypothetical protein
MKKRFIIKFAVLLNLLVFASFAFAQSGRTASPTPTPQVQAAQIDSKNLEKVRLVFSNGFDNFIRELNNLGKSGYKIEKVLNYGGEGAGQFFAAVVRLDESNSYQYDWLSSPNKNFLESRLNFKARSGFKVADAFALTTCDSSGAENDTSETTSDPLILRLEKGDVFLLEKKNGGAAQTREYKVYVGKIGLGKNPTQALQTALDNAPAGFRPVKILFNKSGFDFAVSILLEKDVSAQNPVKIEYKFVKEVNGFEKEVNALAAQGFRLVSGRRIGLVKLALMMKESSAATRYSFIDKEKYAKEFDKTVAQGNVFQTVSAGDLTCDSSDSVNEKLVFASDGAKKYEYKILKISEQNADEFNKAAAENYQFKDLFFYKGLNFIFEK